MTPDTPSELALVLGGPLPAYKPVLCDLTGGRGHLVSGLIDPTTSHGLLCDHKPMQSLKAPTRKDHPFAWNRITADVLDLYPILAETGYTCDLFALRAPEERWPLTKLSALENSPQAAVKAAYREAALASETIPASTAVMMLALDRMTERGEGLIITKPGLSKQALMKHVWLTASVFIEKEEWAILYFAAGHFAGPQQRFHPARDFDHLRDILRNANRDRYRCGAEVLSEATADEQTVPLWDAVKTEWQQRQKPQRDDYHLRIEDGLLRTQLTRFDVASQSIPDAERAQLSSLDGQSPNSLVLQSTTRATLMRVLQCGRWRLQPGLGETVDRCVAQHRAARAPLRPLAPAQRLGFLDEQDTILCTKDFYL